MSQTATTPKPEEPRAIRADRLVVLAFAADAGTEQVLRDGLAEIAGQGVEFRRGTIRTAINAMARLATPEMLIVDISGEDRPMEALSELSDVVEPGVGILVVGDTDDLSFYRQVVRGVGVQEYIFKPITRESVARFFAPLITRTAASADVSRGGRVIAVIGARGGAGATTIATNLAWYLGVMANRHTAFLEAEPFFGAGAAMLGASPAAGLGQAFAATGPLAASAIEAAVDKVADRLHVLSCEERAGTEPPYAEGAARRLIEGLRVRYNFIVVDVPFTMARRNRDLIQFAHQRVVVADASLAGMRDALRLLGLPRGPWQPQTPTLVVNRLGRPGGLTAKQIQDTLKRKIDVAVPDLPKQMSEGQADKMPVAAGGRFAQAIVELSGQIGFVGAGTAGSPERRHRRFGDVLRKMLGMKMP